MPGSRFAPLLWLALAAPAAAQEAAQPPKPCVAPEYRQFDFWIGRWNVERPDGSAAGVNRIEPILGGCALKESWEGRSGFTGTSYNIWDRQRQVWHQTWVDGTGGLLRLEGRFADNRMVLQGETLDSTGGTVLNRIIWEPTGKDRVRQLWETSTDGGKTWSVAFDGRYRKS